MDAPAAVCLREAVPVASAESVGAPVALGAPSVDSDEQLDTVQLDASKLHCYRVALELHTQCSILLASTQRVVRDQLERASLSVVLNIAEAAGRRSRRDKARHYTYARGSATEVAAVLDVLDRRRIGSPASIRAARRLAIRVVQMLSRIDQKLVRQ